MANEAFRFPSLNPQSQRRELHKELDARYRAGLQEGYDKGHTEASQSWQEELEAKAEQRAQQLLEERLQQSLQQQQQQFEALAEGYLNQLNLHKEQLREELFELVSGVSQTVVDGELKLDPHKRLQAIDKALELLHGKDEITGIHFSLGEAHWLKKQKIQAINGIPVQADEQLQPGAVHLVGKNQIHVQSFQQRLASLLDEVKAILMEPSSDD